MSAPVDVLAVMEEARSLAADQRDMNDDNNNKPVADSWESFRADVVAARAAIAELIEADLALDAANRVLTETDPQSEDAETMEAMRAHRNHCIARRAAALRAVSGEVRHD